MRKLQPSKCGIPLRKRSHVLSRPQDFDQVVNGNQYVLVDFYSPTCTFCKALAPEYAAAAAQLAYSQNADVGNVFDVVMAKVDAVSTPGGEALADRFNVTGFPTLIWFVNGKPKPYTQNPGNAQDRSDIVFWVVSQTDVNTRALTQQVICPVNCPHKFESAMR